MFAHTCVDDVCVVVVEGADPRLVVMRSPLRLHLQGALRAEAQHSDVTAGVTHHDPRLSAKQTKKCKVYGMIYLSSCYCCSHSPRSSCLSKGSSE